MKKIIIGLMLLIFSITPAMAGELEKLDFEVKSTQNLIDLCTAPSDHPLFPHAVNFCHGYLVGAYHYYEASMIGEDAQRFVCPPETRPTRNEIIAMFVKWAQDHPEYMNELPVETQFRFLSQTWPCGK